MLNNIFEDENTLILNGDSIKADILLIKQFQENNKKRKKDSTKKKSAITILLSNETDFTDKRLSNIKAVLKLLKKKIKDINVTIVSNTEKRNEQSNTPYVYSNNELCNLIDFNNSINQLGIGDINFSENFCDNWSFNTVLKVNMKLNSIVQKLKKANLSPYETMILIHKFASDFEYKNSQSNSVEAPRCLPGVFENGEIVCVGYAHLIKTIIDKLDMKGLKAEINSFSLYGKQLGYYAGGHANNRIIIEDEKYHIKGSYYEDACWDCKNDIINKPRGYAHFMYIENDSGNFKKYFFEKNNGLSMKALDTNYSISAWRYGEEYDEDEEQKVSELRLEAKQGKPICLETFRKAYTNVLAKISEADNVSNIETNIESIIKISAQHALDTFEINSENAFYKEAIEKKYRPLKETLTATPEK